MQVTVFRFSARYVHVGYSIDVQWRIGTCRLNIEVQCRIRTCKLHHSGSVPDTYMYVTSFKFSVGHVDVGYSIQVKYI
jgi:hypothetical protein